MLSAQQHSIVHNIIIVIVQVIQELFADEQFLITVRTHNTNKLFAEVSLLLKEQASERDLLKGLAVAHFCRDFLHQQRDLHSSSRIAVSFHETRNRVYSKISSTKNRIENMTFGDSVVAMAMNKINQGMYVCVCV
jgi:hypothetical protein